MKSKVVLLSIFGMAVVTKLHAQTGRKPITYYVTEKFLTAPNVYGMSEDRIGAVRSDGSKVEVRRLTSPAGNVVEQRTISDLAFLRRTTIDGLTQSFTTYKLDPKTTSPPSSCSNETGAPHSSLLGYDVVNDKSMLPGPADGSSRFVETWRTPTLDCLALDERFTQIAADGTTYVTNIRQVTRVEAGDPDPALFTIPAGYTERSAQRGDG